MPKFAANPLGRELCAISPYHIFRKSGEKSSRPSSHTPSSNNPPFRGLHNEIVVDGKNPVFLSNGSSEMHLMSHSVRRLQRLVPSGIMSGPAHEWLMKLVSHGAMRACQIGIADLTISWILLIPVFGPMLGRSRHRCIAGAGAGTVFSEWMMFSGDDIGAQVTRKSDGKEFWLGLAELKATSKKSRNAQLLHDFAVFLVNSR